MVSAQLEFADRQQVRRARRLRALGLGIEAADAFQRVAEEIEPHRAERARREQVEDAAAHRIFAGLHHRAGAVEARCFEALRHVVHAGLGAGGESHRRPLIQSSGGTR